MTISMDQSFRGSSSSSSEDDPIIPIPESELRNLPIEMNDLPLTTHVYGKDPERKKRPRKKQATVSLLESGSDRRCLGLESKPQLLGSPIAKNSTPSSPPVPGEDTKRKRPRGRKRLPGTSGESGPSGSDDEPEASITDAELRDLSVGMNDKPSLVHTPSEDPKPRKRNPQHQVPHVHRTPGPTSDAGLHTPISDSEMQNSSISMNDKPSPVHAPNKDPKPRTRHPQRRAPPVLRTPAPSSSHADLDTPMSDSETPALASSSNNRPRFNYVPGKYRKQTKAPLPTLEECDESTWSSGMLWTSRRTAPECKCGYDHEAAFWKFRAPRVRGSGATMDGVSEEGRRFEVPPTLESVRGSEGTSPVEGMDEL